MCKSIHNNNNQFDIFHRTCCALIIEVCSSIWFHPFDLLDPLWSLILENFISHFIIDSRVKILNNYQICWSFTRLIMSALNCTLQQLMCAEKLEPVIDSVAAICMSVILFLSVQSFLDSNLCSNHFQTPARLKINSSCWDNCCIWCFPPGEGDSWKDELLELTRSKQERTMSELRCLRQVLTLLIQKGHIQLKPSPSSSAFLEIKTDHRWEKTSVLILCAHAVVDVRGVFLVWQHSSECSCSDSTVALGHCSSPV